MRLALILLAFLLPSHAAFSATILVLQFHNSSSYPDLNWVGEGISETLRAEIGAANQIVLGRDSRAEGMRRLSLRPDAAFTKATLIRLGQSLDADYICYGTYEATMPAGSSQLRDSSIRITSHLLDLRKLREAPELSEAGKLTELSRLEEHLAWGTLRFLEPTVNLAIENFMTPAKFVRLDAQESYVRGLLSSSGEQQKKWFAQAALLDPHFSSPVYELGQLYLVQRDYRQAMTWLGRIASGDPLFEEARFKMGLSSFRLGDYNAAAACFRDVAKTFPLGEIYNNLGAAEVQMNQPAGVEDLRRAVEADPSDPMYQFNLGLALIRVNSFDEVSKYLNAVLAKDPNDSEARNLLERAQRREPVSATSRITASCRLKEGFNRTPFRQLKSVVQQPKNSSE